MAQYERSYGLSVMLTQARSSPNITGLYFTPVRAPYISRLKPAPPAKSYLSKLTPPLDSNGHFLKIIHSHLSYKYFGTKSANATTSSL